MVTDTDNIIGDNACHEVSGGGVTETGVLDGLISTAENADVADTAYRGGGMYKREQQAQAHQHQLYHQLRRGNDGRMDDESSPSTLISGIFRGKKARRCGGGGGARRAVRVARVDGGALRAAARR